MRNRYVINNKQVTVYATYKGSEVEVILDLEAYNVIKDIDRTWTVRETRNSRPYVVSSIPRTRKSEYMHRVIIGAGKGEIVDHINGNSLDNSRSNLRITTHSKNSINSRNNIMPKKYTDRERGVTYHKTRTSVNKWRVSFVIKGKHTSYGFFPTLEEANKKAIEVRKQILDNL